MCNIPLCVNTWETKVFRKQAHFPQWTLCTSTSYIRTGEQQELRTHEIIHHKVIMHNTSPIYRRNTTDFLFLLRTTYSAHSLRWNMDVNPRRASEQNASFARPAGQGLDDLIKFHHTTQCISADFHGHGPLTQSSRLTRWIKTKALNKTYKTRVLVRWVANSILHETIMTYRLLWICAADSWKRYSKMTKKAVTGVTTWRVRLNCSRSGHAIFGYATHRVHPVNIGPTEKSRSSRHK